MMKRKEVIYGRAFNRPKFVPKFYGLREVYKKDVHIRPIAYEPIRFLAGIIGSLVGKTVLTSWRTSGT